MSSRELTLTRRLVCYVLSGALALSVVPAPALAEALGATDELAYPDEWDEKLGALIRLPEEKTT